MHIAHMFVLAGSERLSYKSSEWLGAGADSQQADPGGHGGRQLGLPGQLPLDDQLAAGPGQDCGGAGGAQAPP